MPTVQDLQVHAPLVIAEGVILIFICSVMVFLRFYTRRISGSSLGLDDFAIAAALLFVIGMAVTLIAESSLKGLGYPSSVGDAGPGHPDANVAGWPGELIQVPALGCIKLSFLLLYRRVFTNRVTRRCNWINWFMIVTITAWMIGYFFTLLFLCGTHFNAYWTSPITEQAECLPTKPVHLGYAISDVLTDVLTILLPIPEIWKLHMSTRRKLATTGVFGLGAITIAMSIIRMVIYYRALTVQFDPDEDFEYITTLTSYFSLLEAGLGLCAACLPVHFHYGLLRPKKVRSVFQSACSLATLGSRGSHGSRSSHRLDTRSYRLQDSLSGHKNGSDSPEIDVPPPIHKAAAARHELSWLELEVDNSRSLPEIVVTKSFDVSGDAV